MTNLNTTTLNGAISTLSRIRRFTVIIYYKQKNRDNTYQTHTLHFLKKKVPAGMQGFGREKDCQTISIM